MPKPKTWLDAEGVRKTVAAASVSSFTKAANLVETEAKRLLSKGGGGLRSSKPGSPPNAQSGNLRREITHAATPQGTAVVGPTKRAFYGKYHEFGGAEIVLTKKALAAIHARRGKRGGGPAPNAGTKKAGDIVVLPKRPFMRPALFNTRRSFPALFKRLPLKSFDAVRVGQNRRAARKARFV